MQAIETLLKARADGYAAPLGELDEKVSGKHFKKGSAYCEATVGGKHAFKKVRDSAIEAGTVLEDDEEAGVITLMAKGGAGGMAPVLLVALVEGNKVTLGAYSKEGLIPQHAAKELVTSFAKTVTC